MQVYSDYSINFKGKVIKAYKRKTDAPRIPHIHQVEIDTTHDHKEVKQTAVLNIKKCKSA